MTADQKPPAEPVSDENRRPWREGPKGAATQSWLTLDDDDLLQRIETLTPHDEADARLLEVVQSDRHFFVRQEAAKRIHKRTLLFVYEDDRHIGQILVRHLNRREDVTYLERLVARSQHTEVRSAAQVQLSRLRRRFPGPSESPEAGSGPATGRPELPGSWRITVIHADADVRRFVTSNLPAAEFVVSAYGQVAEALSELDDVAPHLVLADVTLVLGGTTLTGALRRKASYVPLVVLCPGDMNDPLIDVLGRGADEFIVLPVQPALLAAKTRALVHFAHRTAVRAGSVSVSGAIGHAGVLSLFRSCEERRLTGRLSVVSDNERRFVDFVAGEMAEVGGDPPVPEEEALAALLAIRSGTYEVAETARGSAAEQPALPVTSVARALPSSSTPATALAPAAGQGATAPRERGAVDATLLGWAVHFVVEQAWPYLGTTVTTGVLRRTQTDMLGPHPSLCSFYVEENAHVNVDLSHGARMPRGAVVAVALWMAAFVWEARQLAADLGALDVRRATALMADALEQAGFYAAYDIAAAQRHDRPQAPSVPIGIVIPRRTPK